MKESYQQIHRTCGGIIVLIARDRKGFLMCRDCFQTWQTTTELPLPDDFVNPPRDKRETVKPND